jgi:flagellar basal body-associated protein FliL
MYNLTKIIGENYMLYDFLNGYTPPVKAEYNNNQNLIIILIIVICILIGAICVIACLTTKLTKEQKNIIKKYNNLNEEDKKAINKMFDSLNNKDKE